MKYCPKWYFPITFPCGSTGKGSTCNVGNLGSIPGLGRSPGEGKGYPLQYSSLENSTDCIAHGVAKNQTQLSDFHSLTHSLTHFKILLAHKEAQDGELFHSKNVWNLKHQYRTPSSCSLRYTYKTYGVSVTTELFKTV